MSRTLSFHQKRVTYSTCLENNIVSLALGLELQVFVAVLILRLQQRLQNLLKRMMSPIISQRVFKPRESEPSEFRRGQNSEVRKPAEEVAKKSGSEASNFSQMSGNQIRASDYEES